MDSDHDESIVRATTALVQRLESLHRAGVQQLTRPPSLPEDPVGPAAARAQAEQEEMSPSRSVPATHVPAREAPTDRSAVAPSSDLAAVKLDLQRLEKDVQYCTRCAELASTRTRTVFGVGDPQTRLCFLGEAPGADEDRQGEPFVGAAGQLLNKIIAACTLQREEVYILNVLKCRPPGNRAPEPDEVAHCRGYFEQQLAIIRPEFICCLGAVAAQSLLRTTRTLSRLRGRLHEYQGSKVVVTYHPSYLLRNPDMKRATWDDMKILMREMGLEPR
jgi:DNA polymerase